MRSLRDRRRITAGGGVERRQRRELRGYRRSPPMREQRERADHRPLADARASARCHQTERRDLPDAGDRDGGRDRPSGTCASTMKSASAPDENANLPTSSSGS
jgi:hypothetical protein